MVLVQTEAEVAGLEGLVSVLLALGGNLEDLLGVERLGAVLGEVLVGVAHGVGLLHVGSEGGVALELTTVGDEGFLLGLVAGLGRQVLDLANDGLAVEDFAKDNVLVVEVGGGNGGDEELGAVGV